MSAVGKFAHVLQVFRSFTLSKFSWRYPNTYLIFVTATALVGYFYILIFPIGTLFGLYQLYSTVTASYSTDTLLGAFIWISVSLFCAGITHGIATLRFKDPEGILLQPDKAQLIFNKLEEINEAIKWPKINKVILTRRFELNIIKTPLRGAPFWSQNILVVGYPFMQTLSPAYFDCALTRRLLQFAKRKNLFINWLSYLRSTWLLYPAAFKQRNKVGDQLGYWFFRLYGGIYHSLAAYITQRDELYAASLALSQMNDRDVFKTVETIRVVQFFLNQHYWPKLSELLSRNSVSPQKIRPYDHLPKSLHQMMCSSRVNHWLKLLTIEQHCQGNHEAPFARRMDRMGYGKVQPLKPFSTSAAQYYFGPVNIKIAQYMNKLWAFHVEKEIQQTHQKSKRNSVKPVEQQCTVAF